MAFAVMWIELYWEALRAEGIKLAKSTEVEEKEEEEK